MKSKSILTIILSLSILLPTAAQKIAKKEIDKFTGNSIIETKGEYLFRHNFMMTGYDYAFYFLIRKVNNAAYSMPCRILLSDIEKYDAESGITFLLEDGNVVKLFTLYTGVGADRFANGYWFDTVLDMSEDDVQKLKSSKITDIRIDYFGNYYDYSIKDKNQELIMQMLNLVDNVR